MPKKIKIGKKTYTEFASYTTKAQAKSDAKFLRNMMGLYAQVKTHPRGYAVYSAPIRPKKTKKSRRK